MPAYTRVRTQEHNAPAIGRYYHPITKAWSTIDSPGTGRKVTTDVVGNRKGINPFESVDFGVNQVVISGFTANGYQFDGCPTSAGSYGAPVAQISHVLSDAEANILAMDAVAKTNINAPAVSLPTYWAELKDLPGLIRSFGREHLLKIRQYRSYDAFAKEAMERNLQYRWGIATMISDVKKMWDFTLGVEKRLRWLQRLINGEKIRRTVTLSRDQLSSSNSSKLIWGSGTTIRTGPLTQTDTQQTWASVEWELDRSMTSEFPLGTQQEQLDAAYRAYFGVTTQALALSTWEVLPWSWLADWFFNVQSFLTAVQNSIPVKSSRVCVMRKTETIELGYPTASVKTVTLTGRWKRYKVTKIRRAVGIPNPVTVSFVPLIEADKLLILGSLAALRRPRKRWAT